MPRFERDDDARRLGEALAALRRERGLSQAEAGRLAGMTSQGWGLYESGKRPGLFRPDVQRRLTQALNATPEDLALRLGSPAPRAEEAPMGLESRDRAFAPPSPGSRRLQLSDDDLAPWAGSGVVLEYEVGRWPRRDQGCVIETLDGCLLAKLYRRADEKTIVVAAPPGLEGEARIARSGVRSVSAVVARLER